MIGRLREPLLQPNQAEREGYVPNVVYTCGALVHGDKTGGCPTDSPIMRPDSLPFLSAICWPL